MEPKNKPDMIIFVMAYLGLLGLGALFSGLIVFGLIIPAMYDLGSSFQLGSSLQGGVVVMGLLGILALLVAVVAGWAMIGLWQGKAAARAMALFLTAMMLVVSAFSIPMLLLVGMEGIALVVPLATAVFLLITGSSVCWGLTRPSISLHFRYSD